MNDDYTVGAVAELAGISVRTLHHYDQIGLLTPSERTSAGYRQYSRADLQRLQQILLYRELGVGLDEIAKIIADPGQGVQDHLRHQHRLLRERITRYQAMVAAIEKELEAQAIGISLTPDEQLEIFGTDKVGAEWAKEAEQRWGDTDAWKQSRRRTAAYPKQDWIAIKAEADAGLRDFADAMSSGTPATSQRAMDLAEAHRQYLTRWCYDCDREMHRGLAQVYVAGGPAPTPLSRRSDHRAPSAQLG